MDKWKDNNLLRELARDNGFIERALLCNRDEIIKHLMLLYFMPNGPSKDHWKKEIYGFLKRIYKQRATNKYPSKDYIYKTIFEDDVDIFDNIYTGTVKDLLEEGYIADFNHEREIFNICCGYFDYLADELSKTGEIDNFRTYDKLDDLIYEQLEE